MMITKRTILDQVEITRIGHIQIRLRKEIVDGGVVLSHDYHRTSVETGGNIEQQMQAVNEHLQQMGWPPVDPSEYAEVKEYARVKWTPTKLAEWEQIKAALTITKH